MIRRRMVMMLAVVAMVMGVMAPASADEAACSGAALPNGVIDNHGQHITRDYVNDADTTPGDPTPPGVRGRASHSGSGLTPGSTFCNQHGQGAAHAATVGSP